MKTLTILFESPNVFKVLPEWPNYPEQTFDTKANGIRIENPNILNHQLGTQIIDFDPNWIHKVNFNDLNDDDIFQVEGFEYEVNNCNCVVEQYQGNCQYPLCKRAILKLAKEEEPKEQDKLFGACYEFECIGYNQAIDDIIKLAFERTSEHKPSISLLMIKEIEKLKK